MCRCILAAGLLWIHRCFNNNQSTPLSRLTVDIKHLPRSLLSRNSAARRSTWMLHTCPSIVLVFFCSNETAAGKQATVVQASRARSGWSSVWATSSIHTTLNRWCVQEPHANSEIFNKLCINIPGYTVLRNILTKFSNHSDIIIKLITPHAPHYLSIHPNQYAFLLKSLFISVKVELQKNNGQQDSVSAFCSVQIIFHISLRVQLALLSSGVFCLFVFLKVVYGKFAYLIQGILGFGGICTIVVCNLECAICLMLC